MAKRIPKQPDQNFAYELGFVIENYEPLYKQLMAIEENMRRKMKRGTYDFEKSIKGFRYVADAAARYYKREHGEQADVPTRNYAAQLMATEFLESLSQHPHPTSPRYY